MRRNNSGPTVVWEADVKEEELEALKALMPMYGSRTWLIQTALDKFLSLVETSPRYKKIVKDDIQRMLHDEKEQKIGLKSINLRITTQQYNRFNECFPEFGGTTWFIRRIVKHTVMFMQQNNINLEELVEVSVNNILKQPVQQ